MRNIRNSSTNKISLLRSLKHTVSKALLTKLFNRHIFINKYTRHIPYLSKFVKEFELMLISRHTEHERAREYKLWLKNKLPTDKSLSEQNKIQARFRKRPVISIIVPVFNTNSKFLRECIDSVISQTYDNWQLCLADDASTDPRVLSIIREYATQDSRIRFVARKKNGHICRASNSALKLADGDFVALLDHDDKLWPNALYEVVKHLNESKNNVDFFYTDEDKIEENSRKHIDPFFKPDWSPEYLRSINYITHFAVIRRELVEKVGGFRPGYEGAQDWDLFLRIARQTNNIKHIPKVLYSWRKSATSTAQQPSAKDYAYANQKKALVADIKSRGLNAELDWQIPFSMWRVRYKVKGNPLVSIIIPTKDQFDYIERCLRSMRERTDYKNIEVVIVDTGSTDKRVWELYDEHAKIWDRFTLLKWTDIFNFSAVCNFGADHAEGQYFLFLNNDTEVITPTWVGDMLGYAQQLEIGAVGCRLLYPDGRLQHGGIILGVGGQNATQGIAGHYFPGFLNNPPQDPAQLIYTGGTRNFAAVTAAVVMVARDKFYKVKGFDEKFRIAFNDVDFCLKLLQAGLRSTYLPHVQLYHYESVSVGKPGESKDRDIGEFAKEINMMLRRWEPLIKNDPYYHPEFRRDIASARINIRP